jgi:hypothetical protein
MAKLIVLVLVAFVAIAAIFIFAERAFSPTFRQCVATHQNGASESPSSLKITVNDYVRCSARLVKVYEASIAALGTIIIAAFTGTLWIATSTQARLTREAFIADKRAFVFASGIQPLYEPDANTDHFNWRVGPIWQNSGDTPTQGLRIYTDGFLSNVPIPAKFDFNQIDPRALPGPGMLGPKMSSAGGQAPHMPGPGLTPQDLLDIQNGRKFFYLWGWARYRDGLPGTPEHITRYCWRIICTGNPLLFNPLVDPTSVRFFNLHETRGNCADEECRLQGLG